MDVPKDNTTMVMLILGRVATMPVSPSPLKKSTEKLIWKCNIIIVKNTWHLVSPQNPVLYLIIIIYILGLTYNQGWANYTPWTKSSLPHDFVWPVS